MAPIISHLTNLGHISPEAYSQLDVFKAGVTFAKAEGIVPAPEANHAVKGAIEAALRCKESGENKTILFIFVDMVISTCKLTLIILTINSLMINILNLK